MAVSECPQCTFHIPLRPDMAEGDVMECPDCGARIKLVSVYPPVFESLEEEQD